MLTSAEREQLDYYQKQLALPRFSFIIRHGLSWAIALLLIMSLIEYFGQHKTLQMQWDTGLPLRMIVILAGGLIYGWISRTIAERKYRALKEKGGIS